MQCPERPCPPGALRTVQGHWGACRGRLAIDSVCTLPAGTRTPWKAGSRPATGPVPKPRSDRHVAASLRRCGQRRGGPCGGRGRPGDHRRGVGRGPAGWGWSLLLEGLFLFPSQGALPSGSPARAQRLAGKKRPPGQREGGRCPRPACLCARGPPLWSRSFHALPRSTARTVLGPGAIIR